MSGGWWKEGEGSPAYPGGQRGRRAHTTTVEGAEPEWQWVVRWLLSLVVGQQGLCEADGSKSSAVVVFSFQGFCGGFRFVQSVRGCVFAACAGPVGGVSG